MENSILFFDAFPKLEARYLKTKINILYRWIREGVKKKYGIFNTLVGWVGLKKSFSIKMNMGVGWTLFSQNAYFA